MPPQLSYSCSSSMRILPISKERRERVRVGVQAYRSAEESAFYLASGGSCELGAAAGGVATDAGAGAGPAKGGAVVPAGTGTSGPAATPTWAAICPWICSLNG